MKATLLREFGAPEVLRFADAPDPVPAPGEVLVRVTACGVNRSDTRLRAGDHWRPIPLPHILGSEAAGIVVGRGDGVVSPPEGTRVAILPWLHCGRCEFCETGRPEICRESTVVGWERQGAYAELVTVPTQAIVPLPPGLQPIDAAALTLSAVTARHLLVTIGGVRPGETVLVLAAGSGLGVYAVQIAAAAGARVIATAGSDTKLANVVKLGAEPVDHRDPAFGKRVRAMTDGRGADLVIEHVGPATWEGSMTAVASGGRIVVAGGTTGNRVELDLLRLYGRQIQVLGGLRGRKAELETVLRLAVEHEIRPIVDRILPLSAAAEAHRAIEGRDVFGKILLTAQG